VTSLMLSRLLPFLVSLVFWRKKPRQNAPEAAAPPSTETEHAVTDSDVTRSREVLKVLKLEREIIGTALTTIYESEIQRIITRDERDRLLDKYSSDLKALESRISEHQRIVDTFDLESAKKELSLSYRAKVAEIDKKLADLRSGATPTPSIVPEPKSDQVVTPIATTEAPSRSDLETTGTGLQDAKARTEKKIEAIKEEVLKAMERLEQIESEG
jgi:ribosomal protein L7/L12